MIFDYLAGPYLAGFGNGPCIALKRLTFYSKQTWKNNKGSRPKKSDLKVDTGSRQQKTYLSQYKVLGGGSTTLPMQIYNTPYIFPFQPAHLP
jgi:hypothetical protein